MKTITMFKKRENGFLRYRNLLLSLCALGGAVFAYDPPVYPQLSTERGYGMVDAFISGHNANDDAGIFRSDYVFRSNQSGHSHRLNQTINGTYVGPNKNYDDAPLTPSQNVRTPKRWQVKVRDDKLLLLPPPKALVLIFK